MRKIVNILIGKMSFTIEPLEGKLNQSGAHLFLLAGEDFGDILLGKNYVKVYSKGHKEFEQQNILLVKHLVNKKGVYYLTYLTPLLEVYNVYQQVDNINSSLIKINKLDKKVLKGGKK